jgi:amino acid permease
MGLLAMPFTYNILGLYPGLVVTVLSAICCTFSLWFLYRFSAEYNVQSYPELGAKVFGKAGEVACVAMMFLLVLCPVTGFIMVSGEWSL